MTKRHLIELFALGVSAYGQKFCDDDSSSAKERFYRLTRACFAREEQLREAFAGAVDCNEARFGGHRKGNRGWGVAGKVTVAGLIQRNGTVKSTPIASHSRYEVMRHIQEHTLPCSLYYADEWQAYAAI